MAKNQALKYYVHDESDAVRLEMAGNLSGVGAQTACRACEAALSIAGDRALIVDITFVAEADDSGRALLLALHQNGARIISASRESRALVRPILAEPIPKPPRKQYWVRRLRTLIWPNADTRD